MNKVTDKVLSKNKSKISSGSLVDLTNPENKEILSNMMVDFKTVAPELERQAIRQMLTNEFGKSYNFSEDFISRVMKKLSDN